MHLKERPIAYNTLIVIILILLSFFSYQLLTKKAFAPTKSASTPGINLSENKPAETNEKDVKVIATDLDIPWAIDWLPDGDMLVTERPGNILRISPSGDKTTIDYTEQVSHVGESGLLGLTIHPDFSSNSFVYIYLSVEAGEGLNNQVVRYELIDNSLENRLSIVENIPGKRFHSGGRIRFGPDNLLYITTGDGQEPDNAQNEGSLSGKILRVKDDGSIPSDNPFDTEVYSYGHRNPQGIAWDNQDRLWSNEHGRSGVKSGFDEINLIREGLNYGWPILEGDSTGKDFAAPAVHSGANETWAPAGLAYLNDYLFFTGLRGQSLYQAKIDGDKISNITKHFSAEFGRLREIIIGPDGFIYITTSNRDGRATPSKDDDKIIKINPQIFFE